MTQEYDAYAITSEIFADYDDDIFDEAYQLLMSQTVGATESEFRAKAGVLLALYQQEEEE